MVSIDDLPYILRLDEFQKFSKYQSTLRLSNNFEIQLKIGMYAKIESSKTIPIPMLSTLCI